LGNIRRQKVHITEEIQAIPNHHKLMNQLCLTQDMRVQIVLTVILTNPSEPSKTAL